MADTVALSPDQIKVNAGNNFLVWNNSTDGWLCLGIVGDHKWNDKDAAISVPRADGFVDKKKGLTDSSIDITLNQNDPDIVNRIAGLVGKKLSIYIDNGFNDDGDGLDLFCHGTILKNFAVNMGGGQAQLVGITVQPYAYTPNSVKPSTDLPTTAHSHANATDIVSPSPFWHYIKTAHTS